MIDVILVYFVNILAFLSFVFLTFCIRELIIELRNRSLERRLNKYVHTFAKNDIGKLKIIPYNRLTELRISSGASDGGFAFGVALAVEQVYGLNLAFNVLSRSAAVLFDYSNNRYVQKERNFERVPRFQIC
ncbi:MULTISPECIES: hypothetical protein [unclassified Delftia]|uniref:hypothetical protein n=1 Tax=unclassified Delftia TaxID=2613839 RepID=UPI00190297BA|nr:MULTISPECIES: hypothetical protein [unclassified Delftia]MBK0115640.1 hypothetical protein [Delftia sp. S65]MBK0119503.1 hypothetical protein [Delftia sp. S67]MBK0130193.1 hypothetical protein [Delftia sp. S66]